MGSWEEQISRKVSELVDNGTIKVKDNTINGIVDTTEIVANRDGNLIQRLKYIIAMLDSM